MRFSDGRLLTAADVVYSLKRNIHPSISLLNFLNGYISAITAPAVNTVLIAQAPVAKPPGRPGQPDRRYLPTAQFY